MINTLVFFCILYFIFNSYAYCATKQGPDFQFNNGELILPKPTEKELVECRRELANISNKNISKYKSEGVLFDCKVLDCLSKDRFGQSSWIVECTHIYTGAKELRGKKVKLVSPTLQNGGIFLRTRRRYRVYAIDFGALWYGKKSNLYIWKTSVLELK